MQQWVQGFVQQNASDWVMMKVQHLQACAFSNIAMIPMGATTTTRPTKEKYSTFPQNKKYNTCE